MAIYLDYEGVKGNVTADGYKDMINLRYFKFGVSRKISMKPGEMTNRENSQPKLSVVHIEKFEDVATIALFKAAVAGSEGKRAILHFVRTGTNKPTEYMTYTLENCLISKYFIFDTDITKAPHEHVQLSFTSILISQEIRGANNKTLNTLRSGYDLEKAKSL